MLQVTFAVEFGRAQNTSENGVGLDDISMKEGSCTGAGEWLILFAASYLLFIYLPPSVRLCFGPCLFVCLFVSSLKDLFESIDSQHSH